MKDAGCRDKNTAIISKGFASIAANIESDYLN